jgi:HEAT repeat protein
LDLDKGRHTLSFICVGRDGRSSGYNLGINDVVLEKISRARAADPKSQPSVPRAGGIVYRGLPLSAYLQQLNAASGSRAERVRAIGAFGENAAPAIKAVADALTDPDADVRMAAAWALTQTGAAGAPAIPALEKSLGDENPRVRSLSAVALRSMGPKAVAAVSALIHALGDSEAYVRAPVADAIGSIGPMAKAAVQPLTERLLTGGEQVYVLRSVASALGNIGPDAASALPALQQALRMHRVTYTAQEAILKIKKEPVPTWF